MGHQDSIIFPQARLLTLWNFKSSGWDSAWSVLVLTTVTLLVSLLARFWVKLYQARKFFWKLQKQGVVSEKPRQRETLSTLKIILGC